jgi:hypothetical protein
VIPVARCGETFVCLAGKAADELWQVSAAAETRVQAKAVALAAMQSAWPDLHVELVLACTWGEAHTIVVVVSELDASAWVAHSVDTLSRRQAVIGAQDGIWCSFEAVDHYYKSAKLHAAALLRVASFVKPSVQPHVEVLKTGICMTPSSHPATRHE